VGKILISWVEYRLICPNKVLLAGKIFGGALSQIPGIRKTLIYDSPTILINLSKENEK